MIEKLRSHIDYLFEGAPATRLVQDAREELMASCTDKYKDLLAAGRTPDEAFDETVAGIGDVDELLGAVTHFDTFNPVQAEKNRKRRAFFIATAIFLYIVGVALLLLFDSIGLDQLGLVVMLLVAAVGTFVMVFGNLATRTTYQKKEDTMVEEIKEQMIEGKPANPVQNAVHSALWSLILVAYFLVSFLTGAWHLTWLVFPIGGMLSAFIGYFFQAPEKRSNSALIWPLTVAAYLLVSFLTGRWDITWILFLVAVALQQIVKLASLWRSQQ